MFRFHLDESVNPAIAEGLRLGGIDCTISRDVGLLGASDEEQLAFATSHQRTLVTTDDDFLALAPHQPHAGILYWHQERRSIGEVIRRIVRLCEQHTPEAMRNQVMFL
jgi:predicted nuclease of predicted toxin-antitoxin system